MTRPGRTIAPPDTTRPREPAVRRAVPRAPERQPRTTAPQITTGPRPRRVTVR